MIDSSNPPQSPADFTSSEDMTNDRGLALHEFKSMTKQMQSTIASAQYSSHVYRRDRLIGFCIVIFFLVVCAGLIYSQVVSVSELRKSLFETCVSTNAKEAESRSLYANIAKRA